MSVLSFYSVQHPFLWKKNSYILKLVSREKRNDNLKPFKPLGSFCGSPDDSALHGKSFGRRKKRLFTVEEDKLIIRLREKDKLSWREIGKRLNRHGHVCNTRYKYNLLGHNQQTCFNGDRWCQLEVLVKEFGPDWQKIAEILQFPRPEEVQTKYAELLARRNKCSSVQLKTGNEERDWEQDSKENREKTSKSVKSSPVESLVFIQRRQVPFTTQEDKFLLEQLKKFGSDWNRIVEDFPWRTRRTVMKRLTQLSTSCGSLRGKKLRWEENEDNLLIDLFIQHGRCWSLIARSLFGKSPSQCYRRFLKLQKDEKITITKWTESDDKRLVCSVGLYNENWSLISRVLKYWSHSECERRYYMLQRENKLYSLERMVLKEVRKGKSSELLSSCTIRTDEHGFSMERCWLQEVFVG